MNKTFYETPSSEAFEVSLEGSFVNTNLQDPTEGQESGWDDGNP